MTLLALQSAASSPIALAVASSAARRSVGVAPGAASRRISTGSAARILVCLAAAPAAAVLLTAFTSAEITNPGWSLDFSNADNSALVAAL